MCLRPSFSNSQIENFLKKSDGTFQGLLPLVERSVKMFHFPMVSQGDYDEKGILLSKLGFLMGLWLS